MEIIPQKASLFWQPGIHIIHVCITFTFLSYFLHPRTTDTQWRHKSKKFENLGWCGRQNMLRQYLKIWEWEWIFGHEVKAISSPGVHSPCLHLIQGVSKTFLPWWLQSIFGENAQTEAWNWKLAKWSRFGWQGSCKASREIIRLDIRAYLDPAPNPWSIY